jgi:mono/diheme cytochrome c family protein
MSFVLKVAGGVLAAVLVLALGAVAAIYVGSNARLKQRYEVRVASVVIPTTPEAIERGRHLAHSRGCADCHGADMGGAKVIDDPAMGRIHGSNLTRGAGGLPGSYSDTDYVRAIRHGVAPDGRGLFLMPSEEYASFSEVDLGSLVAYLKSLPAVDRDRGPIALGPIGRMLTATGQIKLAAERIDHANVKPATVSAGVTPAYGSYVAASCTGCHGPNFSGGKIAVGPPDWPLASNLTSHASAAIAQWTETDFIQAMRTSKRPDGSEISAVMPRAFAQLDDTELKALWMYFKTLPPVATGVR